MQRDSDDALTNRRINEVAQERPPSYNECCGAPPLYTSPYNMVSISACSHTFDALIMIKIYMCT